MIHYGITEQNATAEEYDDSGLKSDISSLKSDLTAEKLKISTNKTGISVNKAAIASEKTKLGNTRTLLSNLSGQLTTVENTAAANKTAVAAVKTTADRNIITSVNANTRSKENKLAIAAVKSTADTNRQGLLITPTSQINYHLFIPDLSSSYRTVENVPSGHWPPPLMQFGSIDTKTTFRLIGIVADKDQVIPSANFNAKFKIKAWTSAGVQFDKELYQLNLNSYRITGKPYFSINKDITLRSKFLTEDIKCGMLYVKHMHGAQNISVEMIISCAILQF